jgi:transposase
VSEWKRVHAGRLRSTTSEAVDLVASSGRSIDSIEGAWVCAIFAALGGTTWSGREPTGTARYDITQATVPSADHAAEIARLQ